MIIRQFEIPDSVYKIFSARHKTDEATREAMIKHLEVFGPFQISEKVLLLTPQERRDLVEVLDKPIDKPGDLLNAVKDLCSVKIQGINLNFDAELLHILKDQADFYGRELNEYIEELLKQQLFVLVRGY